MKRAHTNAFATCSWLVILCCALYTRTAVAEPCDALGKACPRPVNAESARGVALGTGARATAISTSALAYNPAALVVGRLYQIEGAVDYMPDMHTVALGGAIVDSSTSRLSAGLSLRGFVGGDKAIGGIDGRLALAFPLSDAVSLGVAGRYIAASRDDQNFLDAALRKAKGFTLDASLRIAPVPAVQLYFGGYNLINLDSVYAPVMLGGGAGVSLGEIAVLAMDVMVDMTSYSSSAVSIGGGLEFLVGNVLPLRAGYSYDIKREQNVLSLGLGYTDASVGLDISLRQDLGGAGDTRLMGAFRVYVH